MCQYLDEILYLYHGVDLRDLDGIIRRGFRYAEGKASFSIDPSYVLGKYTVLGENSRHRFSSRYLSDFRRARKNLKLPSQPSPESAIHAHWRASSELTALLIVRPRQFLYRPAAGAFIHSVGAVLYGGLSKWMHLHIGIWDCLDADWEQRFLNQCNAFIRQQDGRYGTKYAHSIRFYDEQREVSKIHLLPQSGHLKHDNLVAAIRPTPELRSLLSEANILQGSVTKTMLAARLVEDAIPLRGHQAFRDWERLADEMLRGIYWGALVCSMRGSYLFGAQRAGYVLTKIDSPGGAWEPSLGRHGEKARSFSVTKLDIERSDKLYESYQQECLKDLQNGLRL